MDIQSQEVFLNSPQPGSLVKYLPWNTLTPVTAYERMARGDYGFLLESVKGTEATARYSFVGTEPYLILRTKGSQIEIEPSPEARIVPDSPIHALRKLFDHFSIRTKSGLPPFFGGAVGLLSYDLVRIFEKLPRRAADDLNIPDIGLMFVDTILVFDHSQETIQIIYTPPPDRVASTDRKSLLKEGLWKIARLEERLSKPVRPLSRNRDSRSHVPPEPNFTKAQYIRIVQRCQEYIAAGDIYQANLSQRFSVPFHEDPWSLYKILRGINPAPFAGYLHMGDLHLVSASPERLIRLRDGILETRPIAGTRPRGKNRDEDAGLTVDLLANEKERAEHLMLVDLERNDLGRVCRYGSVRVDEFMAIEMYSHVIHIVSNIRGELLTGKDCLDVLRAVFPGGTITGVPKIRCMEIIEELEPVVRGPYTGSFGYIGFHGGMDLNLIIRTFVIKNGRAHVQVGGGIVADSEPEREHQETLYKAEALLRALDQLR